eukprot:282916_1
MNIQRYMGFRLCGLLFFFTCLVMGMASACKLYTEFADAVCWIIIDNEQDIFVQFVNGINMADGARYLLLHYIDDFFGGAPAQDRKCSPPCQILIYLGYVFDLTTGCLGIPRDRLTRYIQNAATVRDVF